MAPALVSVPQVNQHCSPQEMNRELCHQQEALWELLTTELSYLRKLKIMTDVSHPQPQPHLLPPWVLRMISTLPLPEQKGRAGGWRARFQAIISDLLGVGRRRLKTLGLGRPWRREIGC